MPNQTTYTAYQQAGLVGYQADMSEWDAPTKTASATIAFGAPVSRNGDRGCQPLVAGTEYIGIAKGMFKVTGSVADAWEAGENVPVANEGNWYGLASGVIAAGAPLKWDSVLGRWTTAAGSATIFSIAQAEAETSAVDGAVFIVKLRRVPN
jgi:hypothetical protein